MRESEMKREATHIDSRPVGEENELIIKQC